MLNKTPLTETQAMSVATLGGHDLVIRLHKLTPRQRATLAAKMHNGEVTLRHLTRVQAALLCKVSRPLVDQAVNNEAPRLIDASMVTEWLRSASFGERVDVVRGVGVSDVWDALSTAVA
jgi:hypothetical protein